MSAVASHLRLRTTTIIFRRTGLEIYWNYLTILLMYNRSTWGISLAMDCARMSGEELVRACLQGGDESAWVEFIRRFHPMIAGVAFRIARRWGEVSPQTIDDLVQETYLNLYTARVNFLRNFES